MKEEKQTASHDGLGLGLDETALGVVERADTAVGNNGDIDCLAVVCVRIVRYAPYAPFFATRCGQPRFTSTATHSPASSSMRAACTIASASRPASCAIDGRSSAHDWNAFLRNVASLT